MVCSPLPAGTLWSIPAVPGVDYQDALRSSENQRTENKSHQDDPSILPTVAAHGGFFFASTRRRGRSARALEEICYSPRSWNRKDSLLPSALSFSECNLILLLFASTEMPSQNEKNQVQEQRNFAAPGM